MIQTEDRPEIMIPEQYMVEIERAARQVNATRVLLRAVEAEHKNAVLLGLARSGLNPDTVDIAETGDGRIKVYAQASPPRSEVTVGASAPLITSLEGAGLLKEESEYVGKLFAEKKKKKANG